MNSHDVQSELDARDVAVDEGVSLSCETNRSMQTPSKATRQRATVLDYVAAVVEIPALARELIGITITDSARTWDAYV